MPLNLIDQFVEKLNARDLDCLSEEEIPDELRTANAPSVPGWYEWKIRPIGSNPWVEMLEKNIRPHSFPVLYNDLIKRYRFARFELGPIMFFANTGGNSLYELSRKIFADQHMSPVLLAQGLLQFGQPFEGNYDPICFATRNGTNEDAPIVQIDHEDILSFGRRGRVVQKIARSFTDFVEDAISGKFSR